MWRTISQRSGFISFLYSSVVPQSPSRSMRMPRSLVLTGFHVVLEGRTGESPAHSLEPRPNSVSPSNGVSLHQVLDEVAGQIEAVERHEIAGAALAQVDLEELVLAVALVVLHVEVRHALVLDGLQEGLDPAEHVLVVVGDDRRVVAYRHGGGVLKQRMAEEHHAHAVVLVHVGVEHAHMRVVAGDEVLDHHLGGVSGVVGASDDRLQLLRRVPGCRPFLRPSKSIFSHSTLLGRLHGHRVVERQGRGTRRPSPARRSPSWSWDGAARTARTSGRNVDLYASLRDSWMSSVLYT